MADTIKLTAPNGAVVNVPQELADQLRGYKPVGAPKKRAPRKKATEPETPVENDELDDEGDEGDETDEQ